MQRLKDELAMATGQEYTGELTDDEMDRYNLGLIHLLAAVTFYRYFRGIATLLRGGGGNYFRNFTVGS